MHIKAERERERDLVRRIGAAALISNSDPPSRPRLKKKKEKKNAGNVVSILKISAYHFSLQFKIKGSYTLQPLTQQNEVMVHVVITAG